MNTPTRRTFLKTSGLKASVVAATATALTAKSYARVIGANERLGVGLIGCGGQGGTHTDAFIDLAGKNPDYQGIKSPVEPIITCDCWETRAKEKAVKLGIQNTTTDYRDVLERDDVDYVTIVTPEHQHCQMVLDAMDAGKPIYCEKPMTHAIDEAIKIRDKQKATGVPIQVGVQGMSEDTYASAAEAIKGGLLGQVVQAQIEYVRRYNSARGPWRNPEINNDTPKPADLNWKDWLGDATKHDWDPHRYFEWRNYQDYSGGICTDLFIHRITRILKACDLGFPRRAVGMGGIWQWPDGRELPDNFEMICEYPRGMTVYVLGTMSNRVPVDHLIRGYRATMYFSGNGWVAKDKDGKILDQHEKSGWHDVRPHHANFHDHLRNGAPLNCPIELGAAGVAAVCMANESWRTGQMMGWDPQAEKMVPANTLPFNPNASNDVDAYSL